MVNRYKAFNINACRRWKKTLSKHHAWCHTKFAWMGNKPISTAYAESATLELCSVNSSYRIHPHVMPRKRYFGVLSKGAALHRIVFCEWRFWRNILPIGIGTEANIRAHGEIRSDGGVGVTHWILCEYGDVNLLNEWHRSIRHTTEARHSHAYRLTHPLSASSISGCAEQAHKQFVWAPITHCHYNQWGLSRSESVARGGEGKQRPLKTFSFSHNYYIGNHDNVLD